MHRRFLVPSSLGPSFLPFRRPFAGASSCSMAVDMSMAEDDGEDGGEAGRGFGGAAVQRVTGGARPSAQLSSIGGALESAEMSVVTVRGTKYQHAGFKQRRWWQSGRAGA